ncbi:MAG: hypothetical protein ACSHXB_18940 [Sulfitobacter sp.]
MTIIIPIFGYLIIFNDTFAELLASSMNWVCSAFRGGSCAETEFGEIDRDFLLRRVVNIYFALTSIAASTLFYQLFCPHEIKKFGDVESYVATNTKVYHHEFNRRLWSVLKSAIPETLKRVQERFDKDKEFDRSKASEMFDRDMLYLWFEYQNHRFLIVRWSCFFLFALGSVLLAFPTITVFLKVLAISWAG